MGDFNRDRRGGGRRFGGGGRDFNRGPKEMFHAVCDNCGKDCEVPFRPTSGKPVYCNDCFSKMGGRGESGGRGQRDNGGRQGGGEQLLEINQKLDKILSLLGQETKSEPKPSTIAEEAPKKKRVPKKEVVAPPEEIIIEEEKPVIEEAPQIPEENPAA